MSYTHEVPFILRREQLTEEVKQTFQRLLEQGGILLHDKVVVDAEIHYDSMRPEARRLVESGRIVKGRHRRFGYGAIDPQIGGRWRALYVVPKGAAKRLVYSEDGNDIHPRLYLPEEDTFQDLYWNDSPISAFISYTDNVLRPQGLSGPGFASPRRRTMIMLKEIALEKGLGEFTKFKQERQRKLEALFF